MEIQESRNRVVETATEPSFRSNQCVSDRQTGVEGTATELVNQLPDMQITGKCAFTKIEYRQQSAAQ